MTQLHHEIFINATQQKVWAALADLEAVQHYNPLVSSAHYTSGHRSGVGAARHCDFLPKGFSKEQVTAWEEGKSIGFDTTESSFPMSVCRWKTNLIPENGGTLVSQDLEYQVKFGLFGRLLNILMMKRKYNSILGDIFEGLKKYVENQ